MTVCGQGSFPWRFNPFSWRFLALKAIQDSGSDICSEDPESGDERNKFEETKFLCDWLQHHLSDKVGKVHVSKLLMSPFALNSAKLGFDPELQRVLGSARKLTLITQLSRN